MLFNKSKKEKDEQQKESGKTKDLKNLAKQDKIKKNKNIFDETVSTITLDEETQEIKLGFGFRRHKTRSIIKNLKKNNIKSLLFYTDVENLMRQLEYGISPVNMIKLQKAEEYTVWTYLEKPDHIELELDSSGRHYFWKWINDQMLDPNNIAVVCLDIMPLFETTKKDWTYDESLKRISVYENIKPSNFKWILIKDNGKLERIKQYVETNKLKVKVFYGEKGNIEDLVNL